MIVRTVNTELAIGGTPIPVLSWEVTLSSTGQLARVTAKTSYVLLDYYGINIVSLSQGAANGAQLDVSVGYNGNSTHIFGGVLDECRWELGDDEIHIKGVDYGVVLQDTRSTVASINYTNATIGNIVQQIADAAGLQANITDPGALAGPLMNNENALCPHPQQWWSLIEQMADQCGYEYFVNPDGVLYFGPVQSVNSIDCTWGVAPSENPPPNPLLKCVPVYQPRENNNFQVKVISYHPQKAKNFSAVKDMSGTKLARHKNRKMPSELVSTSNGNKTTLSTGNGKPSKKPTFIFRFDGLTADQCAAKAQSIAADMAKRMVILEGTMEGNTDVQIHSTINLNQGLYDCGGFDGLVYDASEVRHTYQMPKMGASGGGFQTHFKAFAQIAGS